jgi:hypothetical protein
MGFNLNEILLPKPRTFEASLSDITTRAWPQAMAKYRSIREIERFFTTKLPIGFLFVAGCLLSRLKPAAGYQVEAKTLIIYTRLVEVWTVKLPWETSDEWRG